MASSSVAPCSSAMLVTRKMDRDEQKRWDEYEARAVERHREYMAMLDAVFNQERR